jgi:hypothetical protein
VALPEIANPSRERTPPTVTRVRRTVSGLRSSCGRSILGPSWCIPGGGPLNPATDNRASIQPDCAPCAGGLF